MNTACPRCGHRFERESGYFIGAMIASYFLGTFLALPTLLCSIFLFDLPIFHSLLLSSVQLILFQPLLFRTSRILWIRIEAALTRSVNPDDLKPDS
jgi:hypothetical protein